MEQLLLLEIEGMQVVHVELDEDLRDELVELMAKAILAIQRARKEVDDESLAASEDSP